MRIQILQKNVRRTALSSIEPDSEQIKLFGLKHSARALAEKADVPLLPGTGLLSGVEEAVTEAEKTVSGYLKEHRRRRWNRNEDL